MVFEIRERDGRGHGEIVRVAPQLGTTTEDRISSGLPSWNARVRELRRVNEILKAASPYFARELDPSLPC
jgi:transposase